MRKNAVTLLVVIFGMMMITSCDYVDPVEYNDALVEIQKNAYTVDEEMSSKFNEQFWSDDSELLGKFDSKEYKDFADKYKKEYEKLFAEAKAVKDFEKDNKLKKDLIKLLECLLDGVDSYYTKMMTLIADENCTNDEIKEVEDKYIDNFNKLEEEFLESQKTFATNQNFILE